MNNTFFKDGQGGIYLPLGIFGCYFPADIIGEEPGMPTWHGAGLLQYHRLTKAQWRKFFSWLQKQGYTALRMFPRGESIGSAWEGLDLGGRLNRTLFGTLTSYMEIAREYGIRFQLCLFTQPECSVYCNRLTAMAFGPRRLSAAELASPMSDGYIDETGEGDRVPFVPYERYFSDPAVRRLNKSYLDELIPLLPSDDVFAVELYNEIGWSSPNALIPNAFRWEYKNDIIDWCADMVSHIKRLAPGLPVCVSNPGVSLLGHDPAEWQMKIKPDFYSVHNYPDCCGYFPGLDYALMSDAALKYTMSAGPAMYGEWQCLNRGEISRHDEGLLARDMVWLSLLSGAPGTVSWLGQSWGEYGSAARICASLAGHNLDRRPPAIGIDISDMHKTLLGCEENPDEECSMPPGYWCPDTGAPDKMHRFCKKFAGGAYERLMRTEQASLESGADFDFTFEPDKYPLNDIASADPSLPVEAPPGYHLKYMAAQGGVYIAYLRNYVNMPVVGHHEDGTPFEMFALRDRRPVPLKIMRTAVSETMKLDIFDLDKRGFVAEGITTKSYDAGVTSHDFVLIFK